MNRGNLRPLLFGSLLLILVVLGLYWVLRIPDTEERSTLLYWTHTDPNRTTLEGELIRRFSETSREEDYDRKIDIQRMTYGSQEISELVLTAFAAGRGPDIFNLQIENAHEYIVSGEVVPLDPELFGYDSVEEIAEVYVPGVLEPVMHDGKLYGLPLELTNWAIYLNRSMFRDLGLDPDREYPKTWEDMVRVSQKLVEYEGDTVIRRGFDFRYSDYLIGIVPMARQLGGRLVSENGTEAIVGEEAWIEFLRFFRQWGPTGMNLGSPAYPNARSLFNRNNGTIAMAHTGLYQQGRIKGENPTFFESGEWMVIPFPVFENAVKDVSSSYYGHYMMVNAETPKELQRVAWQFIWFLLEHSEEYLSRVNIVQPKRALMESDLYRSIPFSDIFSEEMERAEVVYYSRYSAELQELVEDAVESVLFGRASPEKAYVKLRTFAQALIEG